MRLSVKKSQLLYREKICNTSLEIIDRPVPIEQINDFQPS